MDMAEAVERAAAAAPPRPALSASALLALARECGADDCGLVLAAIAGRDAASD